ncbi:hypothetical protein GBAR_LOCUS3482 [Geodia barretti]|uniref:Uncharacterized protein n=1 Tax=Geodia barretti TaxID=519541 RepID=A0AA35R3H8_GEOBA|nr:hypothetical protein GBAR_LOCUS3482 [Geodia barretti]
MPAISLSFPIKWERGKGLTLLLASPNKNTSLRCVREGRSSLEQQISQAADMDRRPRVSGADESYMKSQLHILYVSDSRVYEMRGVIPGDYQGVNGMFCQCLECASEERPLYYCSWTESQLSSSLLNDGAGGLSCSPRTLPPHVKLVLSSSSEPN